MCNQVSCAHDPLDSDDDLATFLSDFGLDASQEPKAPLASLAPRAPATFTENCKSCGGNGRFISWAGRYVGPCRPCKGSGKLTFKTSPAQRQSAKASADKRSQKAAVEAANSAADWMEAHAAETEWLVKNAPTFEFASSLFAALNKYGHLTENQLAAVRRILAKNVARDEQRAAEKVQINLNAPTVTVGKIADAFAHAQDRGVKRPKMRLDTFKFSLAPATGRNAGSIYVTEDDIYLGKVTDGRFFKVRDCSSDQEARIVQVCSNPSDAATAYGQRTGACSICGRELTAGESINRSIGPICAEKYGF